MKMMERKAYTAFGETGRHRLVGLPVDVDEKYECRRGASLPASWIFKNYNPSVVADGLPT